MTAYNQITSNKRRTVILLAGFIIIIIALGFIFAYSLEWGFPGLIMACFVAVGMSLFSYYKGDSIALWTAGAKGPITDQENSYVYRMVENLSITAGLPNPKTYIIQDSAINAFATGRDPEHASIAITTGAIEILENEELEGVIAHELAHVKNYDIRLMTIVIICVSLTTLLANWFFRFSFWGGGRRDKSSGNAGMVLLIIGIVLAILSPFIAKIIQMAISRKREFLADASGVLLTRYPDGLAKALEKIETQSQPLAKANKATAHLYISNPFGKKKSWFANMFSTHPPIEERVKALRSMAK